MNWETGEEDGSGWDGLAPDAEERRQERAAKRRPLPVAETPQSPIPNLKCPHGIAINSMGCFECLQLGTVNAPVGAAEPQAETTACEHRNSHGHEGGSWCWDCGKQLSGSIYPPPTTGTFNIGAAAPQAETRPLTKSVLLKKIRDGVENYCGHPWPDDKPAPNICPECDKIVQSVMYELERMEPAARDAFEGDVDKLERELDAPLSCLMCGQTGEVAIRHEPSGVWICMACRETNRLAEAEHKRVLELEAGLRECKRQMQNAAKLLEFFPDDYGDAINEASRLVGEEKEL